MKNCSYCKELKPYSEFSKNKKMKCGYNSWCRVCSRALGVKRYHNLPKEKRDEWRNNNIEHIRDYKLRVRYGITFEEKCRMIVAQGNKCAGCGYVFSDQNSAHVDHDHNTGKIRGILCRSCNTVLGYVDDDIEVLKSLRNYLILNNIEERRPRKNDQKKSDSHALFGTP